MDGSKLSGVSFSLEGKVALISGGSRGIGAATVRLFRQAGARVVFSYRLRVAEAEELVKECGGSDYCLAVQQELCSVADGHALVHAAITAFGRVDNLIVNHGIWPPHDQPIESMSLKQWRDTMGINLDSVFGLVQAATAHMLSRAGKEQHDPTTELGEERFGTGLAKPSTLAQDDADASELLEERVYSDDIRWPAYETPHSTGPLGHIVLVASTAAQRGEAFHADYATSKGALISLTKSLSSELAPKGILANCVAPGWVVTEMSAGTLADPIASKKALSFIPLGRAATPEEIAGPILFLCTKWAGFISGEIFNVNGGAVLVG
ncbi:SDR family NAD(P)-dependent oxidoreductase [Granulicella cerasi]|uniref:SDR family NAD(P)-dependent oxidoreductase n=1 Tax=Granulicella cerasi TaxID=741063 RepID=A0ABW1Z8U7_9BACT|nr:SDR family oxidoreductase [Granulicella cerasi]